MGDIQLTAYNLAYRFLKGENPKSLCIDVMVKNKKAKVQTIEAGPRSEQQLKRFLRLLGSIAYAVKQGVFYPCENAQVCGYCGYSRLCRKWA